MEEADVAADRLAAQVQAVAPAMVPGAAGALAAVRAGAHARVDRHLRAVALAVADTKVEVERVAAIVTTTRSPLA